ncbi:MAG: nucleotidyl transferase AbiEii/AbiGii toxin family protein [Xanthobacteraceae bacterium]|nr:nucleotidyl transferase AbiEii/AbiGii toxin family protein [Xanthobacteraceae bacterium]
MPISLEEVRRRVLIALFSDDVLMDELVLKGGNALALVYKIGSRASVDLDFSLQKAFADVDSAQLRISDALKKEFRSVGYVIFDESLSVKPAKRRVGLPDWWGGYLFEFKLAEAALAEKFKDDKDGLRRQSTELGPLNKRKFSIDISTHEFCEAKVERDLDDFVIYVYSLEMIVAEKLRAICQQMPAYEFGNKTARARDFYDIEQIISTEKIDMTSAENLKILGAVFEAKGVPIELLSEIKNFREFHQQDWPAVQTSISGQHEVFEYYFNFVVELAASIEATRKK